MEVLIRRDPEGNQRRVYIKQNPLNTVPLALIQEKVSKRIPEFKPFDNNYIHLTLAHFGKPQELITNLQEINPELTEPEFRRYFNYFLIWSAYGLRPRNITLPVGSLGVESTKKGSALILGVSQTPSFIDLRCEITNKFATVLRSCGVGNDREYIAQNPNLRFLSKRNYSPHISLGFLPSPDISMLSDIDPMVRSLFFSGHRLTNVRFRDRSRR